MTGRYPTHYDSVEGDERALPPASSARSRGVALILGVLGGVFGLHRFYAGRTESGIWMAVTLGGLGMWWLYDMVLLIAGEFRDGDGLLMREWEPAASSGRAAIDSPETAQLAERLEQLEQQLGELSERMDFTERLLTQQRDRDRLGKGP